LIRKYICSLALSVMLCGSVIYHKWKHPAWVIEFVNNLI
jgi:hypothetical protein